MREIKCSKCGKVFMADDLAVEAYCVYCGQLNNLSEQIESVHSDDLQESQVEWKNQIEALRFKMQKGKNQERSDTLVGFWIMLLFHGRNSHGFFNRKRAIKEANQFWQRSGIASILKESGTQADQLIFDQLYDSIRTYYQVCREDLHYGTKLFNLVKLKREQIADKTASEISDLVFSYWLHLDPILYRDQIFKAAWFAFSPSFPDDHDALAIRVKQLPEADRQQLSAIIGIPV